MKINNADIDELIQQDKAIYTCEVDCIKTVWRQSFPSKSPNFTIRIPRKDLAGNISFNTYVSVKESILDYHNSGFNSDYGNSSFNMEPGDILVGFPEVKHHIDIKYDKLQAAGSFMVIHEDSEHSVVNFAFDHDKIIMESLIHLRDSVKEDIRPIFNLFPKQFTIGELQTAYEIIIGHPTNNFRRKISDYVIK